MDADVEPIVGVLEDSILLFTDVSLCPLKKCTPPLLQQHNSLF